MKKSFKFLSAGIIAATLVGCQCNQYKLDGRVGEEWADGTAYCTPIGTNNHADPLDSAIVHADGTFVMKGTCNTPAVCVVSIQKGDNRNALGYVVLEAGNITITSDGDGFHISGTELNDLANTHLQEAVPFEQQLSALFNEWSVTEDESARKAIEYTFDSIDAEYQQLNKQFVLNNSDNIVGAFVFTQTDLSDAEQAEILQQAGATFKAQPQVQKIAERIEQLKKVAVGQPFTDFEMDDLDGNRVKLSDFVGKGKYIVVDFWASWCGPCRRSMPALKALYKQYNSQIDIVGVSFDKNDTAWKECVATLELPWHHMSDLKGWQSEAASIYCINSIPHLMLIDNDGIIVARNLYDNTLAEKLHEIFD
ncbi:MAG: redoxin domain-containing protein [Paludibacteraceae bacterium]